MTLCAKNTICDDPLDRPRQEQYYRRVRFGFGYCVIHCRRVVTTVTTYHTALTDPPPSHLSALRCCTVNPYTVFTVCCRARLSRRALPTNSPPATGKARPYRARCRAGPGNSGCRGPVARSHPAPPLHPPDPGHAHPTLFVFTGVAAGWSGRSCIANGAATDASLLTSAPCGGCHAHYFRTQRQPCCIARGDRC